jgi:thymidylate synthase (FAD)
MVFMSLQAIGHFCRLRFDDHAQKEIQQYAMAFNQIALERFPYSYSALMKGRP